MRLSGILSRTAVTAVALMVCSSALGAGSVQAQTLSGQVLEERREVPLAGAVIRLLGPKGVERAVAISDSVGWFTLTPPEAGQYRVEAVRLGYETTLSPLFSFASEGVIGFEIMMNPRPIGLEGLEVTVAREAERLLTNLGHTPATLGRRWIDREKLAAMVNPGGPRDIIRLQGIAGVWVEQASPLCVRFRRRERACALTVLDGAVIPAGRAFLLDTRDIEAIAILDPVDATTFYGTAAGGGAVLMWTRRGRPES